MFSRYNAFYFFDLQVPKHKLDRVKVTINSVIFMNMESKVASFFDVIFFSNSFSGFIIFLLSIVIFYK